MPLGERAGDKSESRYCGVETEFNDDMPQLLAYNISSGGFDFVVATLVRTTVAVSNRCLFIFTKISKLESKKRIYAKNVAQFSLCLCTLDL